MFANYQNGFKNVAPIVQPLPDISGDLKPQRAETIERDGQSYNITVQDGTRLSRGVELDVTAAPVDGLAFIFN